MYDTPKRTVPIKLIWMFVTLMVMISGLSLLITTRMGFNSRLLTNVFYSAAPIALLSVAAYLCLLRGSLNLALPGIACLCGNVMAQIAQSSGNAIPGALTAVFIGAALGALTGLFAIPSRRKVLLVTGLSSLFLGGMFFGISGLISQGMLISVPSGREVSSVFCWLGLFAAAALAILGSLGRQASPSANAGEPEPSGGMRFLWSVIAGAVAGLGGAVMVVRLGGGQPVLFSNYNEMTIVPVLLLAGILIPNVRRSTGEAIMGGLAVLLAVLGFAMISMYFSIMALDMYAQRVAIGILCALLLIPNLLICRGDRVKTL